MRFGTGRGYGRVQADVRAHETAGLAGRSARDFPYRRFQSFRRIFPDGRARRHDPQDCGEVAARNAECRAGRDAGSPGRRHVDPGGGRRGDHGQDCRFRRPVLRPCAGARGRSGGFERRPGTPAQPEPRTLPFGAGTRLPAPHQRFPQPPGCGDQFAGYCRCTQ